MLISESFPSKYLKAADLKDQQVRVVMDHVVLEDIGDDGMKPILYFQGKDKGLCLNKTNSNNIAMVYGDDTDDWAGRELILYPTMVDFQGRSVPAIRVKVPALKAAQREPQVPAVTAQRGNGHGPRPTPTIRAELNDEVPF